MSIFKSFFAGLVLAIAAPVLDAAIINFDDLISDQAIPNGYADLNWTNAYVYDAADDPDHLSPSGYDVAFVSSPECRFQWRQQRLESDHDKQRYHFQLELCLSDLRVERWPAGGVIGSLPGTPIYDQKFYPSATAHSLKTFNYVGVDSVEFIPSGGTQHPGYTGFSGTYFAIDDLDIDLVQLAAVPEPGTWVAAALLLAVIAFGQRGRLPMVKPIRP